MGLTCDGTIVNYSNFTLNKTIVVRLFLLWEQDIFTKEGLGDGRVEKTA
jgi:hypothetical protein